MLTFFLARQNFASKQETRQKKVAQKHFLCNRLGYGSVSILSPGPVRFIECVTGIIHRDLIQQRLYPVLVGQLLCPAYRNWPKHKA